MTDVVPISEIYDGLTQAQVAKVQQATREINFSGRLAIRAMIATGKRLAEIKPILTANGHWRQWLALEFDASHDSADRFIRVYERFGSVDAIATSFQKGALYLLADKEIPPEVAEIAIERAEQGERITREVAREIAATFQRSAVKVIEEVIATQGTVTLDGQSVTVVEETQKVIQADGSTVVYGTLNKQVIDAAVAQAVSQTIMKDKEDAVRHIVRKGQNKGKTDFLSAGTLDEFAKVMKSGQVQRYKGKIYISLWGLPDPPETKPEIKDE